MQEKDIQENDIQKNYIEKIILDDETEIPVSYPENKDQPGCITVICGKNHSGKSYILKKISEALKGGRNDTDGILQCDGTNLKVESPLRENFTLPEVKKILSIGDPTSTKRIYEEINNITFKKLRDQKIFIYALYFNDEENTIFTKLTLLIFSEIRFRFRKFRYRTFYYDEIQLKLRKIKILEDLRKYFQEDLKEYLKEDLRKYFQEDFQKYLQEDLKEYFQEDFQEYFQEDFQEYF